MDLFALLKVCGSVGLTTPAWKAPDNMQLVCVQFTDQLPTITIVERKEEVSLACPDVSLACPDVSLYNSQSCPQASFTVHTLFVLLFFFYDLIFPTSKIFHNTKHQMDATRKQPLKTATASLILEIICVASHES